MSIPESSFFQQNKSRESLLRAALICFIKEGFGGVSMHQIADEAQTSVQRLIYHFKRPEDLLIELAQMWGESGRLVTLEHLAGLMNAGPIEKIIGISDGMFIWAGRYPNFARLTPVIAQAVSKSEVIRDFQRRTFEIGMARTSGLVALCPKLKAEPESVRNEIARGVFFMIHGAGHFAINTDRLETLEGYRSAVAHSIRMLLS